MTGIAIKPEAVDPEDVEMLQDLVISAVNEALRQADEAMENAVNKAAGGLESGRLWPVKGDGDEAGAYLQFFCGKKAPLP